MNQIKLVNSQSVFRSAIISLVSTVAAVIGGFYFLQVGLAGSSGSMDYLMILLLLFPMLVKLPETYNALIFEANEPVFKRVLWKSKIVLWKNILSI